MQLRRLGKTDLTVSEIGFGCGDAAGLMTRGDHAKQLAVAKFALRSGVNYFDTASAYGDGRSETNLGAVLKETGAKVGLATKVRLAPADLSRLKKATIDSVNRSLKRLGRPSVDVIQLHNRVVPGREGRGFGLTPGEILGRDGVLEGFKSLREQGKVRFFGFAGLGDPESLHRVIQSAEFHTVMVYYNLLNPSAGFPVPRGFSALDYGRIIDLAAAQQMGIIVIRVLARGALTDNPEIGARAPSTLSPGSDFELDMERARNLKWLVAGDIGSLPQAAIRFALMKPEVSTVLVGFSEPRHVEEAVSCSGTGGLSEESMNRLKGLWDRDFQSVI